MAIRLQPPQRTEKQLLALAASGATGFAKKAQAELQRRKTEELHSALRGPVSS